MSAAEHTRLFAVVGDPIAQSLSPCMHNAAIGALGLEARYVALRTTHQAFPALVRELLENGGGCNVTMPFKDDAFALDGEHSEVARRTRAVNCVWGDAARPQLDNTDVAAIRVVVRRLLGTEPVRVVRVVGTGGAGRAAAVAVSDEWPGVCIEVVSRSPERAGAFAEWAAGAGVRCSVEADSMTRLDLLVWAKPENFETASYPVSRRGSGAPYDPPAPPPALDLVYQRGGTSLTRMYGEMGIPAEDGRGVLVEQGGLAFERFFGVPAPIGVMREAVEYALRP